MDRWLKSELPLIFYRRLTLRNLATRLWCRHERSQKPPTSFGSMSFTFKGFYLKVYGLYPENLASIVRFVDRFYHLVIENQLKQRNLEKYIR